MPPVKRPEGILVDNKWRAAANGVAFIGAFVLCCIAIYLARPFPSVPGVGPKFEYFARHKDRYDVIFVGSSRVYHQVIPKEFDATVVSHTGKQLRSFNFGEAGMWPPESLYVLKKILELQPARLGWVLIEVNNIDVTLNEKNNKSARMAYWHDLDHTMLAWQQLLSLTTLPPSEKLRLGFAHGEHLMHQWTNVGRGAEKLMPLLDRSRNRGMHRDLEATEGFDPGPRKALEGDEQADFTSRLERLRRNFSPKPLPPVVGAAFKEIADRVRASGAQPIFLKLPTLDPMENFADLSAIAPVFEFQDPTEFPALYDPALRYDSWHMNERGARNLTHLIAERFLRQWASSEEPASLMPSASGSDPLPGVDLRK